MIGRVYKVIHLDTELLYVGSTTDTIRSRWSSHKSNYKRWLEDESRPATSLFPYLKEFGVERFKMILVKEYEVSDKNQLRAYEQLAMNRHKCVNTRGAMQIIGCRSMAQHYRSINKDQILKKNAEYRLANKDRIAEKRSEYYLANKEKKAEYYLANRDKIKDYKSEYRAANKEKIANKFAEKVTCPCGAIVSRGNLAQHRRSAKHVRWAESQ